MNSGGTLTSKKRQLFSLKRGTFYTNLGKVGGMCLPVPKSMGIPMS